MKVLIYEENHDDPGVCFVASSVKVALDKLIKSYQEKIDNYKKILEEIKADNEVANRQRNILGLRLQDNQLALDRLKSYIASSEWTDDNIEEFRYEPHFYFNWYEVL